MRGAAVTCVRVRLTREDGGKLARARQEERRAGGEDTSMDLVKRAPPKAAVDCLVAKPVTNELGTGEQPVLTLGTCRDPSVERGCITSSGAFASHIDDKPPLEPRAPATAPGCPWPPRLAILNPHACSR